MKMNRSQLINAGKVWIVYKTNAPEDILIEGTRNKCMQYIKATFGGLREYKKGNVRLGNTIWEGND